MKRETEKKTDRQTNRESQYIVSQIIKYRSKPAIIIIFERQFYQWFPNFFEWRLTFKIQIFKRLPVSNFKKCHTFMTSTRRGKAGQAYVYACRREEGSSPMRTSTQKIKIR